MDFYNLMVALLSILENIIVFPFYFLKNAPHGIYIYFYHLWLSYKDLFPDPQDQVMMVGLSGVGKTAILCRLVGEEVRIMTSKIIPSNWST